ncbi:MAG: DUF4236 domain-containing protein [Alphaproteobacteria bacterium]|nr:DUF4236 domain-containing protein [Alphaproteobacteria bacterium]
MGFYLRKSIKAGPLRFNLSKSGVGVSAGVKGFRVGSGPRGNYVHMGRGGLYYRKTLSKNTPSQNSQHVGQTPKAPISDDIALNPEYENYQEIESGDIRQMADSSSAELLAEFDKKRKKKRLWPWVTALSILLFWLLAGGLSSGALWTLIIIESAAIYIAYNYDKHRKNVVLFYDMDSSFESAYQELHDTFLNLRTASKIWHTESKADIRDGKRHAGAGQVVSRKPIAIKIDNAPYLKTNITVPSIPVGKQTLFFFPDRLMIFEEKGVGAVSYNNLHIDIKNTQFIEHSGAPKDARVIDHTWQFVNKSGGPDRRFNNNRQLPICLYEDIHFSSSTGLNELIQFSKLGNSASFKNAIIKLEKALFSNSVE